MADYGSTFIRVHVCTIVERVVPCIPFGVVTTRITIKRNARGLLILGFYMSMC